MPKTNLIVRQAGHGLREITCNKFCHQVNFLPSELHASSFDFCLDNLMSLFQ